MRKLIAIAAIPILATTITACGGGDSGSDKIMGWSKTNARSLCHDQIEGKLKSPSTADFEGLTEFTASKSSDGNSWVLSGYVDAQNSFGATVRQNWSCTVTPTDESNARVSVSLN